jgi:hypothetical protein
MLLVSFFARIEDLFYFIKHFLSHDDNNLFMQYLLSLFFESWQRLQHLVSFHLDLFLFDILSSLNDFNVLCSLWLCCGVKVRDRYRLIFKVAFHEFLSVVLFKFSFISLTTWRQYFFSLFGVLIYLRRQRSALFRPLSLFSIALFRCGVP